MRNFLLATVFSIIWVCGYSQKNVNGSDKKQGSLSGKITDAASGRPLAGASLYFADLRQGTIADSAGVYKFNSLPRGNYILDITYQGFASRAITVSIKGATEQDITLSTTVAENENVTVTGVSKATSIRTTPTPVSVVRKTELYRSSSSNIIEALTRKSGVSAITTGPAIAKPVVRGLGYTRVVTLNDGMRQEGQQWGDEHGIEIDEYSVQRAEILRGAASLMYGSDAIGGVLNIQSYIPVPDNTIRGNFTSVYNSNNGLWGNHADIAGKIKGFSFSAYGSNKTAGDYSNQYDGKVLNSRFKETDYGATVGINRSWGYSHLIFSNFSQHLGIIEGDRDSTGKFVLYPGTSQEHTATTDELNSRNMLIPNQRIEHTRIALDNNFNIGKGRLSALIGYQHNQRREFGDVTAPETPVTFFDLKTINYNIAYHLAERNGWKTSVGVNGMSQQNTNKTSEALIPDYNLFDLGAYVFTQKAIGDKITLTGGIRFDNRNLSTKEMLDANGANKFSALHKSFSNVTGSAGVSYAASQTVTLKANISRAFRAPGVAELTANGAHEGTYRYEIGNRDLTSETTVQADFGAEYSGTHFSISVTPFINRINNYIFQQKLQSVSGGDSLIAGNGGQLLTVYKFNQQTATLAGFEMSFDIHPHPLDWLHFENTVSYVNGTFSEAVDGSRNLPMIAPLRYLSELRGEWAKPKIIHFLQNIYGKIEMDANAKQSKPFTGYNTETPTDGYVLWNIGAGTDVMGKQKKLCSFYFSLNNVFDVAYQSHLSRLKYTAENMATGRIGVFNMGRNFMARLVIPLEFKVKDKG